MGNCSRWSSLLATYIAYGSCKPWTETDHHGGREERAAKEPRIWQRHCRQCSMRVQCVWSNMSISNRPLQPPTHSSNINLFILIIIIILDYSDHHTRSRGIARERERSSHVYFLSTSIFQWSFMLKLLKSCCSHFIGYIHYSDHSACPFSWSCLYVSPHTQHANLTFWFLIFGCGLRPP